MRKQLARLSSRALMFWDKHKRPLKNLYQVPAVGVAYLYRSVLRRPVFVCVTGSLGKTQSKALIAAVLAPLGSVRYDPTTNNRTYDVAKNLLFTSPFSSACVQEIGLAGPGTMARPVKLFRPDISLITNIRSDHYEEFSSHRDHVLEKAQAVRNLPADGCAILNADEPNLEVFAGETSAKLLTYGFSERADVRALEFDNRPPDPVSLRVRFGDNEETVSTRLHGTHNAMSVLAAIAVGCAAGVDLAVAAGAIADARPVPGRMEFREHPDGVRFLLDDFKASVGSLVGVTEYLRDWVPTSGNKILVLGTIAYGGINIADDYCDVIEEVFDHCDEILLVGSLVFSLDITAFDKFSEKVRVFKTVRQSVDYLQPRLTPGDLIVLKGRLRDDHLRRIEISRRATVNCWQMFCDRISFCEDCVFVEQYID